MTFSKESEFESAVIEKLIQHGWAAEVLKNPSEAELLENWKEILYTNNKGIDKLNEVPLTDGEMQQIIEQITELRTPLKLNGFINGKTVAITRDNPADTLHFGKEVSVKIYDRHEIAAGQSRYQIVQQPPFKRGSTLLNDRRGDLLLLIQRDAADPSGAEAEQGLGVASLRPDRKVFTRGSVNRDVFPNPDLRSDRAGGSTLLREPRAGREV